MVAIRPLSLLGLSSELVQASQMIPFAPPYFSKENCLKQIVGHIPDLEEALNLTESYFHYGTFFNSPVERSQVAEEVIPVAYKSGRPAKYEETSISDLPDLALFFAILASGNIMKPNAKGSQPSLGTLYDKFHHLARAALNVYGVFENGSIVTCQTFILIGLCELQLGRGPMRETSWKIVGMAFTIALSVSSNLSCRV